MTLRGSRTGRRLGRALMHWVDLVQHGGEPPLAEYLLKHAEIARELKPLLIMARRMVRAVRALGGRPPSKIRNLRGDPDSPAT